MDQLIIYRCVGVKKISQSVQFLNAPTFSKLHIKGYLRTKIV